MEYTIQIKTAVLHILDTTISLPLLSNNELYIDGEISEFLEKHINKVLDDTNLKKARFIGDSNIVRDLCQAISADENNFTEVSKEIATAIFDIMMKNVDIISGD